ncbi:MAG TPA: PilN domain-containing protein [Syntrophomonas sp.]|nr:PilN domain-containing protein [Syntrophomonas sp.]
MNSRPEFKINLINYKLEQKRSRQRKVLERSAYILIGLLLLGGVFLYNHYLTRQTEALHQENASLQTELRQRTVSSVPRQDVQQIKTAIKARSLVVTALQKQQTDFIPVLDALGEYYDADILLNHIDAQSDSIKISGLAGSQSELIRLLQSLNKSESVSDPSNLQINTNKDTGEISFSMQMSLKEVQK